MGLWNRLTRHQDRLSPFRVLQMETAPTRPGLASLALMRRQELDGFIEGLFGREEMIDLPKHAHRGLDELGQMRALFEAVVVLAVDNAKQATDTGPGDDASTLGIARQGALPRAGHGTLALESSFHDAASRSILAVGEGGRGFIVEIDEERLVITAAHCLPRSPTPGSPDFEELLFSELLGPLGRTRTVTSKCLFYDPVSDLAVLGTPGILLSEAYNQLMAAATPLPIGKVRGRFGGESRGWLLSLAGEWFKCKVTRLPRGLYVPEASQAIEGGMSGSPVLRRDGTAIGVISISSGQACECPSLTDHLPGWLLRRRIMRLRP